MSHASDCAQHDAPARAAGPCDCDDVARAEDIFGAEAVAVADHIMDDLVIGAVGDGYYRQVDRMMVAAKVQRALDRRGCAAPA